MDGEGLRVLMAGLSSNNLISGSTSHLLTGYIGSVSFLNAVIDAYKQLREANSGVKFVCDPVMGDDGKMYVSEEMLGVYRDEVVKLAYMVTPNAFEASLITGLPLNDLDTAKVAVSALHELGPQIVVVTSMQLEDFPADKLVMMVSERALGVFCIEIDKVNGHYTGTGDLVAALLLAHEHNFVGDDSGDKWPSILRNVANTMQCIIRRTFEAGGGELKLIQSKNDIEKKDWEGGARVWKVE